MKLIVPAVAAALIAASPAVLAQAKLSKEDAKYLREFAEANMAEVEAGKLAQSKAQRDEVKKFASHMVDDHGKLLQELQTFAEGKGTKLPDSPSIKHKAVAKKLEMTKESSFDHEYMEQMVKDHQEAMKLGETIAKNAQDPDLKAAAQKAGPHVKEHLQMAQQLAASSKSSAAGERASSSSGASSQTESSSGAVK
jgi:putative membrane protein